MNKYLPIFLLFYFSTFGQASLSGRLLNKENQVLPFGVVSLHYAKDSVLVKGSLCDSSGRFELQNLTIGKYILAGSSVSANRQFVKTISIDDSLQHYPLGDLNLTDNAHQLAEVVVSAKKPLIERKVDRLVANIEGSILAKGNSGLEVLGRLPYLRLSAQGEINLNGSSAVQILIDGVLVRQKQVLKVLRADNIEKIEIYTNPPAKFDADGSGVVNIITKKQKMYSSIYGNYGQRLYPLPDLSGKSYNTNEMGGNLNYKLGKLRLSNNWSYGLLRDNFDKTESTVNQPNFSRVADEVFSPTKINDNFSIDLTSTYEIDSLNEVLLKVNHWKSLSNNIFTQNFDFGTSKNTWNTTSQHIYKDYEGILSYTHQFKKKQRWNIDYNIGGFTMPQMLEIENTDGGITGQKNDYSSKYQAVKTDFSTQWKNYKIETGLKYTSIDAQNNYETSTFSYQENIKATYVKVDKSSEKWELQAGLRTEWTNSMGLSSLVSNAVERDYINFFPSFFAQRKFNDDFQLNFSANRRIRRPEYAAFNPAVVLSSFDAYSRWQGNTEMQAQFSNRYEFGSYYKGWTSSINYTELHNHKTDIAQAEGQIIIWKKSIVNATNWNWAIFKDIAINSKWNSTNFFNLYNYSVLSPNQPKRFWAFDFGTDHSIEFSDKTQAQFSFYYYGADRRNYEGTGKHYSFSMGVSHKITAKLDFTFNIDDIFGTDKLVFRNDFGVINNQQKTLSNRRMFRLNLAYRFKTGEAFKVKTKKVNEGERR